MLGIIRVLTTQDEAVLYEHGRLMNESHGIASHTECIPDQPYGIHDPETEAQAIPKIVAIAESLANKPDISAITISCAADPALAESRSAVDLPVLGAGECGAHAAMMVTDAVAIIGIADAPPERMKRVLGDSLHSYRFSPKHRKATDLFASDTHESLLKLAEEARDEGAGAILFACTGFSTIGLENYFESRLNIPAIDLVRAQAIAYSLITKV